MLEKIEKNVLPFLLCLGIPLAVGWFVSWLCPDSYAMYSLLNLPPLAPPGEWFPIVWTILYILMGISSFLVWKNLDEGESGPVVIYLIQLLVNGLWSVLFFCLKMPLAAFFCLLVLWALIVIMIKQFYKVSPVAALLQIPYLLWVTFAGYLNLAIWFLNR